MLACSVGDGMRWLLVGRMASWVSGESVYLLFRVCTQRQTCVGLVRKFISWSESCQSVSSCCRMSVSISELSVCILLRMSGVGCCLRSSFRSCILCLISRLKVGL